MNTLYTQPLPEAAWSNKCKDIKFQWIGFVLYTGILTNTVVLYSSFLFSARARHRARTHARTRERAKYNWHINLLKNCDLPLTLLGEHSIFTVAARPIVPFPRCGYGPADSCFYALISNIINFLTWRIWIQTHYFYLKQ